MLVWLAVAIHVLVFDNGGCMSSAISVVGSVTCNVTVSVCGRFYSVALRGGSGFFF